MRILRTRLAPTDSTQSGLTLVEITISLMLLMALLMSSVSAFTASIKAGAQAARITRGVFYLETVTENISALSLTEMLALNGNRIFDNPLANDSNYSADISVFQVGVDQVQLRIQLIDLRTGYELGRINTLRSEW
jgi:hypothetical protein